MALEKASLGPIDEAGNPTGTAFRVMFNPKELTFSKSNTWNQSKTPKGSAPNIDFGGGGGMSLKVQLYFDTHGLDHAKPVTELTDAIHQLMLIDPKTEHIKNKKARPPYVQFHWGHVVFNGVIASYGQRLTLFTPEGVPVRAVVDLTLTQYKDSMVHKAQNPTSGGVGGERVWTVQQGDTLPWIAFKEYNNATAWRPIADANGLRDLRNLRPGSKLVIPNA
jgi:nucleoid-associated protein YgaU